MFSTFELGTGGTVRKWSAVVRKTPKLLPAKFKLFCKMAISFLNHLQSWQHCHLSIFFPFSFQKISLELNKCTRLLGRFGNRLPHTTSFTSILVTGKGED